MKNRKANKTSVSSNHYDEEYFLTSCEGYNLFAQSKAKEISRRLQKVLLYSSVEPGMTVLDIGCGRGEIVYHSALKKAYVTGIDYSRAAVKITRSVIDSLPSDFKHYAEVVQADARKLTFEDNGFDRVIISDFVEHLSQGELTQVFDEVNRVMKPEGLLFLHTAPTSWYNSLGYPIKRFLFLILGRGRLPKDPRSEYEELMHINEQNTISLRHLLRKHFNCRIWLEKESHSGLCGYWLRYISPLLITRLLFCRDMWAVCRKEKSNKRPDRWFSQLFFHPRVLRKSFLSRSVEVESGTGG